MQLSVIRPINRQIYLDQFRAEFDSPDTDFFFDDYGLPLSVGKLGIKALRSDSEGPFSLVLQVIFDDFHKLVEINWLGNKIVSQSCLSTHMGIVG